MGGYTVRTPAVLSSINCTGDVYFLLHHLKCLYLRQSHHHEILIVFKYIYTRTGLYKKYYSEFLSRPNCFWIKILKIMYSEKSLKEWITHIPSKGKIYMPVSMAWRDMKGEITSINNAQRQHFSTCFHRAHFSKLLFGNWANYIYLKMNVIYWDW